MQGVQVTSFILFVRESGLAISPHALGDAPKGQRPELCFHQGVGPERPLKIENPGDLAVLDKEIWVPGIPVDQLRRGDRLQGGSVFQGGSTDVVNGKAKIRLFCYNSITIVFFLSGRLSVFQLTVRDDLSEVIAYTSARYLPSVRANRCVPPAPGIMPSRISGCPNLAFSEAMIISQCIASSHPPPRA